MKNTKLITLLKTFSNEEMKSFGKFIDSPYHNSGRNFKPLYSILKKHHPEFPEEVLSEEKLFAKLYAGEKFDKKKSSLTVRVIFSQMTKLARKFMAYEMVETGKGDFQFYLSLSRAFRRKTLFNESLKTLKEYSELLDANERTLEYYFKRIYINQSALNELLSMSKDKESAEYEKHTLLHTYTFFIHIIAGYLNNGFSRKQNYNIEFKGLELAKSFVDGFDTVLFDKECSDDGYETKNITLFTYYITKSLLDKNDKTSLLNAIDLYKKMFMNIPEKFRYHYFSILYDRFENRRQFDRFYLEKANEFFDFANEYGVLDNLSDYYYQRVFYMTLNFKASLLSASELKDFINAYIKKVSPEYQDDLKNYSMAFYNFKKKSFDKCLESISKNDSLENNFKVNKYKLKLCSLYELNLIEDTLYAVDSFEHFIRRKENVGPSIRKDCMEFIQGVKNLIQLKMGKGDNINPNEIKEINKNTLFGDWLSEKVKELLKA